MKLATYRKGSGAPRIGIFHSGDKRLFDLASAAERTGGDTGIFASMLALIDGGDKALEAAARLFEKEGGDQALSVPIGDAELMAPLPEPRQMRDGMSYETHIRQSGRGMRHLMSGGDMSKVGDEELPPLGDVYRQMPIYYITNRMIVSGPGATVSWPRYS